MSSLDIGVLEWNNANDAKIPDEIAPGDLPEVFSFTVCSVLTRCHPQLWSDAFPELRGCVQYFTKVLRDRDFSGFALSASAHKVEFDGREVARCLDDYLDTDCTQLLPERLICAHTMPGKVPVDGSCRADYECEPGTYCQTPSCPGTCVQKGDVGASCSTASQCEDGLECVDARCTAPLGKGDRCNPTRDVCANGRLCVRLDELYDECADWADVYSLSEGEACDPSSGRTCGLGLHCIYDESGARVCAPPVEADGLCQLGDPDPCPADQYCDASRTAPYSGRCTSLVNAGATCNRGIECVVGTVCVDAGCVALRAIGEECSVDAGCYSGYCNSATGECEHAECVPSPSD